MEGEEDSVKEQPEVRWCMGLVRVFWEGLYLDN